MKNIEKREHWEKREDIKITGSAQPLMSIEEAFDNYIFTIISIIVLQWAQYEVFIGD